MDKTMKQRRQPLRLSQAELRVTTVKDDMKMITLLFIMGLTNKLGYIFCDAFLS